MTKPGHTSPSLYAFCDESITNEDYWDCVYDWMYNLQNSTEGENVVVTVSSYIGCNDIYTDVLYLDDVKLEKYLTLIYLYWNGLRVYKDGSVEKIREYADGGTQIIYVGKKGGEVSVFEHGCRAVHEAYLELKRKEKERKEREKLEAKEAKQRKKEEKERKEYERLKAKFGG